MKKILSFALSLMICLMAISCSGNDITPPSTSATTTAATTAASTTTAATTAPQEPEEKPEPLLAGFSEKDITPKKLGVMPGGSSKNTAKKVVMPLLVNAAAFESDGNSLIIVSIDILMFLNSHAELMRTKINEATGVPKENILIAATHTHTGGGLDFQLYQTPAEPETFENTMNLAVEAAIEAWETRERAKMGYGKGELKGYSFCREAFMKNGDINTWPSKSKIDRLISEVDQSVNVIRVDDTEGNLKSLIVQYVNHPDSNTSKQGYNPDYIGNMREALKKKLGEDVTIVYLNGAQGDVNYCDYLGDGGGGRDNVGIGTALAAKVLQINNTITVDDEYPRIAALTNVYDAVQRHPTEENLEWGKMIMEKVKNGEKVGSLDKSFATEYTTTDYSDLGDTFKIEIQTIVLGDFAFACLPCEPFSEIGLKIKAASPFENTVVVGLANGHHGYITPDFVQGTSSYPARFSKYVACAGLGTADLLINNAVNMLSEMKND